MLLYIKSAPTKASSSAVSYKLEATMCRRNIVQIPSRWDVCFIARGYHILL